MLEGLDSIPWGELSHAYGRADDVPALLRALQTSPPDARGEDAPLYQLFGNIWHQGTVYEATAYAVPFLIELAADARTPDRIGILGLLAEIARGSSYRAVHGNSLNELDFDAKRATELAWVKRAHDSVAAGLATFVRMTNEPSDVSLCAAHVLAQLPEHVQRVGPLLRQMLERESRSLQRAGLLLLLGQVQDQSDAAHLVEFDVEGRKTLSLRPDGSPW